MQAFHFQKIAFVCSVSLCGVGCASNTTSNGTSNTTSNATSSPATSTASEGGGVNIEDYESYYLSDDPSEPIKPGQVRVTSFGTTNLLIDDGVTQVMIDAFISRRRLIAATNTEVIDAVFEEAKVDRLEAVFVIHSHYDHSMDVPYVVNKTGATLYGSPSTLFVGQGATCPRIR